jgi:ABC-type dipeptide/oligopeptide/nickel transport systems, permease components
MVSSFQRYIINKTATYIVLWFLAAFLNFLLPRIMPGDPIGRYLETLYNMGQGTTGGIVQVVPEAEKLRQPSYLSKFGLDKPPYTQFLFYGSSIFLRGDWGYSLAFPNLPPVIDLVKTIFASHFNAFNTFSSDLMGRGQLSRCLHGS